MEMIPREYNGGLSCLINDIRVPENVKFIAVNEKEVKKVL
jgi:hypothetical protein